MQEKHLYEYAVIRLVPRVERGEYINIGVVLYCKSLKTLDFVFQINKSRILSLFPEVDLEEVESHLLSFQKICQGTPDSGLIGSQDLASRFRWLTARRSTIIQASEIHPGYCQQPTAALNKIFEEMVLM
ncbi:DUF3037 domain-containing protein [Lacihabitans sp. CS3-21]|jgi:Protein of unknown function (DUF3037)|uniref:DUF3037 domain-containing protein n=1 Tax=Lacihabitans sp. CS3-21 TaxID=2487332 RepID=UPI0020CC0AF9|nr:DUF3037 domain-containing protein [Lacihabitans sp. CS3-21]MCP9749240.1 DUF3037 domain-containing protein [Lacihabitans sp. CS3-21]